ncbi:MAG: hypothetical protein RBR67_15470 [Desulfobacterium sp.]|jgi:hypothetical protein|nr:hypothetical protein [Desulfobacterium sp.]
MRYTSRINKIIKAVGSGKSDVDIKVVLFDSPEIEEKYARYRALEVLKMIRFDERMQTIYVVDSGTSERYENMTVEQAKGILAGH